MNTSLFRNSMNGSLLVAEEDSRVVVVKTDDVLAPVAKLQLSGVRHGWDCNWDASFSSDGATCVVAGPDSVVRMIADGSVDEVQAKRPSLPVVVRRTCVFADGDQIMHWSGSQPTPVLRQYGRDLLGNSCMLYDSLFIPAGKKGVLLIEDDVHELQLAVRGPVRRVFAGKGHLGVVSVKQVSVFKFVDGHLEKLFSADLGKYGDGYISSVGTFVDDDKLLLLTMSMQNGSQNLVYDVATGDLQQEDFGAARCGVWVGGLLVAVREAAANEVGELVQQEVNALSGERSQRVIGTVDAVLAATAPHAFAHSFVSRGTQ